MVFKVYSFFGRCRENKIKQYLQDKRKKLEEREEQAAFLEEMEEARLALETARHNYNFAENNALLEYYIYEIKAAETRFDYYLKRAKREGITVGIPLISTGFC